MRSTISSLSSFTAILDGSSAQSLIIPGQDFLLSAEFRRDGSDLILVGENGNRILVTQYFANPVPPALTTPAGAILSPDMVIGLAGPIAPAQFAQANASQQHLIIVGKVEKAAGTVDVIHPDGTRGTLHVGDIVYKGDQILTQSDGSVGITFADSSTFALGKSGRMGNSSLLGRVTDKGSSRMAFLGRRTQEYSRAPGLLISL